MTNISIAGLNEAINLYPNIDLFKSSIILAWRGSIVHETYIKNQIDDKDVIGVVILPVEYYLGLKQFGNRGTKEIALNEWDLVFYDFKKYINLLVNSNPNIVTLLWLKEDFYIKVSSLGRELINNREKFLTKRIYKSFSGYAYGQLKRMTHFEFYGYMSAKRKSLVEKFGYDCKNASHCIRLLRMGIEGLKTGKLNPSRGDIDADELLRIKRGEWSLSKVKKTADKLFEELKDCRNLNVLPEEIDKEYIEKLMVKILTKGIF